MAAEMYEAQVLHLVQADKELSITCIWRTPIGISEIMPFEPDPEVKHFGALSAEIVKNERVTIHSHLQQRRGRNV